MNKQLIIIFMVCLCAVLTSCGTNENGYKARLNVKTQPVDLRFERYEDVLFNLDTSNFQAELMQIQSHYQVFLGGDLSNPDAVKYLKDFATDPFCTSMYQKVKTAFPDLKEVKASVESVLSHFHYYYPDIQLPTQAYTCITGISADEPAVQIIDNILVISLDWYLDSDEVYDQIGMPRYMQHRTRKATLARDVAKQLYMTYLYQWRKQGNIMNEMVYFGRMNYFMEAMCPEMADEILFSWSSEQLSWAKENEGGVWADIVGQKRLFDTGLDSYLMFFGDGPFTQAYSDEAPARLGEYFGTQIIRSYMSCHKEMPLQQLISNTDLQAIFQESGYKPKK